MFYMKEYNFRNTAFDQLLSIHAYKTKDSRFNPLNPDFPSLSGLVTGAPGCIVDLGSKQTN